MRHETAQAQPIIIDARLGVRFDRYVSGRVMSFSGEKPCEMCRKISAARKDADKEPVTPGEREIRLRDLAAQMIPLDSIALENPAARPFSHVLPHASAGSPGRGHDAPPVPPPCA